MRNLYRTTLTIARRRSDGFEFTVAASLSDDGHRTIRAVEAGCHQWSGNDAFRRAKRFYETHDLRRRMTSTASKALDNESLVLLARLEHQLDIATGACYVTEEAIPAPPPYPNGNPPPFTEEERRNFEEVARSFAPPQYEDWGQEPVPPLDVRTE